MKCERQSQQPDTKTPTTTSATATTGATTTTTQATTPPNSRQIMECVALAHVAWSAPSKGQEKGDQTRKNRTIRYPKYYEFLI